MLDMFKDLWGFMRVRKKFWLPAIIATLVVLSALIVLAGVFGDGWDNRLYLRASFVHRA
jgi:hypothetical protein